MRRALSSLGPKEPESLKSKSGGDEKPAAAVVVAACLLSPGAFALEGKGGERGAGLQAGRHDLSLGQLLPGTVAPGKPWASFTCFRALGNEEELTRHVCHM